MTYKKSKSYQEVLSSNIQTKFTSESDLLSLEVSDKKLGSFQNEKTKAKENITPEKRDAKISRKRSSGLQEIIEYDPLAWSGHNLFQQTTPLTYNKRRSSMYSVYNVSYNKARRASAVSFMSVRSINMYVRSHRKIFLVISITMAMGIVIFTLILMFCF
jgi:hypothetical protein